MKKTLIALVAASAITASSFGSVVINFGMGTMYSSTNTTTIFPAGGLLNLLSLDTGTWTGLGDLNALFSNLTNSFTPAGVTLVGQIPNDNGGGPGYVNGVFNFSYSGAFNAGDQLMIVAYPTLTTNSLSPGLGTPGFFFRTDSIISGSDIAYIAPADGANVGLYSESDNGVPANQFTSGAGAAGGNGFTTVPEPSTYALLAMGAAALGGYVIRRRKRD